MPSSRIEVKKRRSPEQQNLLIEAVHASLVEAFKIPESDKLVRYVEHRPEHFVTPEGSSDNYTLVEISLFPGRSLQAKSKLYQAIVERFSKQGIPPEDIRILLHEVPADNWGIRGGQAASAVGLGYPINV